MSKRFRVAFSFAGEKRVFVAEVAQILAERFGRASILYDKFHEAEFARSDLAFHLPALYHNEADLVVAVFCPNYQNKSWCGLEWNAIFGLIKKRSVDEVMLVRFDRVEPEGLFGLAGFVELDGKTPQEAADLILDRLAVNARKPMQQQAAAPTEAPVAGALAALREQVLGGDSIRVSDQALHLMLGHTVSHRTREPQPRASSL